MDFLLKQNIDKNNFNVFIRDLSSNLNTNLKHIIEDTISNKQPDKINKNHKKSKKPVMKKADIIRAEVNKKNKEKVIKDDLNRLEFLFNNKDINNPFKSLNKLKSKEGIDKMKYMLLEYYWNNHKKNYMNYIISLYYQLKDVDNNDFKDLNGLFISLLLNKNSNLFRSLLIIFSLFFLLTSARIISAFFITGFLLFL